MPNVTVKLSGRQFECEAAGNNSYSGSSARALVWPAAYLVALCGGRAAVKRYYHQFKVVHMNAILAWKEPVPLRIARDGSIVPSVQVESLPAVPGMYVFAIERRGRLEPLYVGLASRSIRQRFVQHLRSTRMYEGLRTARGGKRFFAYAELILGPGGDERRVLGSSERELIRLATLRGYATLNTHQRKPRELRSVETCTFSHQGCPEVWWWSPAEVTTSLAPPRKRARIDRRIVR